MYTPPRTPSTRAMLLAVMLSGGLAACGGGGEEGGDEGGGGGVESGGGVVSVRQFSVVGTDGKDSASEQNFAVIDGDMQGGIFHLNWNVPTGGGEVYRASLFLSSVAGNTDEDSGNAVEVMDRNCGPFTSPECPTDQVSMLQCRFDKPNMRFICPESDNDFDMHDVGTFLASHQGLPGNYFMVFEACQFVSVSNTLPEEVCDTESVEVGLN